MMGKAEIELFSRLLFTSMLFVLIGGLVFGETEVGSLAALMIGILAAILGIIRDVLG